MEYRLDIFATLNVRQGRGKKSRLVSQRIGWQAWNECVKQEIIHGRLKGSGSFYWPSLRAAYRRAIVIMRKDDTVDAIRIDTISGHHIGYVRRTMVPGRYGCHPGQPALIARF